MSYRRGRSYRRADRLDRSHQERPPRARPALMICLLAVVLGVGMAAVITPHIRTVLDASVSAAAPANPCPDPASAAAGATSAVAGGASTAPGPAATVTPAAAPPAGSSTTMSARATSATVTPCPSATATAPAPTAGALAPASAAPAPAANADCEIIVPAHPLSAAGLATPYRLTGPGGQTPEASGCTEANSANLGAFVQATILNPATGALSVYEPLVITQGTTPAAAPVVPKLPRGAVVTIDFGFNGTNLTQVGATPRALLQGHCVNGLPGSIFGQVSFCHGTAFFRAAHRAERLGKLAVPRAGVSPVTGQACPTTRDFRIVDQDQSDNVTTRYLLTASGQTAQLNHANTAALPGATAISNGSDNALLDGFVDPALGCKPFTAPDLSQGRAPGTSQALDELSAARSRAAPVALVPENDPMTLVNNAFSAVKTNLYRSSVGQRAISAANNRADSPANYCRNMLNIQTPFLSDNQTLLKSAASPVPSVGDSLLTFMASRLSMSYANLNCQDFGLKDPVTVTLNGDGVATAASFDTAQQTAANG